MNKPKNVKKTTFIDTKTKKIYNIAVYLHQLYPEFNLFVKFEIMKS